MILDLLFAIAIVFAIFKGYRRGFIVGLFSLVAVIIGLAAAMKLSAVAASYIGQNVNVSKEWLPVLSFVVVFIIVVLLIRLAANAIDRTVEMVMLGWLNKLAGIVLYVIIYTIVFSVLLFYAEQIKLLKPETVANSVTYSYVQPWGPKVINGLGSIIPVFKDMFGDLEHFFDGVAKDLSPATPQ